MIFDFFTQSEAIERFKILSQKGLNFWIKLVNHFLKFAIEELLQLQWLNCKEKDPKAYITSNKVLTFCNLIQQQEQCKLCVQL